MLIRWLFAALHLLGLGAGLGAVWARARALRGPLDPAGLRRVFYADGWWGVAAAMPDTRLAGRFASISYLQAVLVLLMVLAATAMARGIGMVPRS